MNRIAYIISAHTDAQHLARLVDALNYNADFYVHIDSKADARPFEKLLEGKATFVPRHPVNWGGWAQVEYQKELLGAVIHSGIPYSRIVCLSGLDYPLWSNEKIHRYFDEHGETEFIMGYNLTHTDHKKQRSKIVRYHFFRDLKWKSLWWKNKVIVSSRILLKALFMRKSPFTYISGKKADVYFGSDWWALSYPCACYVYEKLCTEKRLAKYFKTSFAPSELCIQTIVFNSPFARQALLYEGDYPGLTKLTPLHYINYGKQIKILTMDDRNILAQCGKMFCRKTVSGISDELMAAIDEQRR